MKKISKSAGFISAMVAGLLAASESQFMLRGTDPRLAKSIGARIGSYAPRQSSPISPSRRFRSKDEANQLKESAALKRERRVVKRYSQYVSTFRGVMRDIENGWIAPLLNNGDFSDLENHTKFNAAHVGLPLLTTWQLRAYKTVVKFFGKVEEFRITNGGAHA